MNKTVIVVASAHRVGSTWLVRMLRHYLSAPGLPVPESLRESPENRSLNRLAKADRYSKECSKE